MVARSPATTASADQTCRLGSGLNRPECVLTTANGDVFTSNFAGGVTRLGGGVDVHHMVGSRDPVIATNGFAIARDGSFLCANLLAPGGVWRIDREGNQALFWSEVDGYTPSSVNFVHCDHDGRTWISVSTKREPRSAGYRPDVDDGFVVLVDEHGSHVVADGLGFTNEAKVDPGGRWLYVNETFVRRTSRFPLRAGGELGSRETFAEYGAGTFPDGLEFDAEGGIWVTSVLSNRLIRVTSSDQYVFLEDSNPEYLSEIERVYQAGALGREHMDNVNTRLKSLSSVAFGGPDLKTLYLGNLLDDCIYSLPSPLAGAPPPHWNVIV